MQAVLSPKGIKLKIVTKKKKRTSRMGLKKNKNLKLIAMNVIQTSKPPKVKMKINLRKETVDLNLLSMMLIRL